MCAQDRKPTGEGQQTSRGPSDMLAECCSWGSPATVLLSDNQAEIKGRFVQYRAEEGLIVYSVGSLGQLTSINDVRLGQHCAVSFGHDNRPRFFVAVVKDYYAERDKMLMEISLPQRIAIAEVRKALRVPVLVDVLDVEMLVEDEQLLRPRVKNLSLTGVLLEFDQADDPKLYPFDKVALRFRLGDESVSLRGIVRRCEPAGPCTHYGLMFPETSGMAEPPDKLRRMVEEVEQRWMEKNLDP